MPVTLTIRSFCSACFGLMCFLMVQCSTSLSLCRSWLREPLRFLEFCSSIYRPGSTSLFCLLPRTCIFGHVISFAVSTCNRLQPYKLEVWEWVVKRRIFDLFCEFSRWVWFVSGFSKSAYIYGPSGWASLMVSPLSCCGILIYSKRPLIVPGRRYRLPY